MEVKRYEAIGETMIAETLGNGLRVFIFPKPEFGKSYAFFATHYGGMDMKFQLDGQWQDTPPGVAHFLEHKMFDTKDGNALQDLAANGASPNAFTSSAITGYYFESTQKFEENLKILLSFVSVPWFTKESVDKEQGIIGQEINMIEDDPGWQAFMNLMAALYRNHPIRVSVAGSRESISHITADTLYRCHGAFYNPANMVLCVAGDVVPERIVALAREILPEKGNRDIPRDYGPKENAQVAQRERSMEMEVAVPVFDLGIKLPCAQEGEPALRQKLLGELACEALLGTSSPLFSKLYAQGLLNRNFSYGYEDYPGCCFLIAGGESRDPAAVRDAILAEADRIGREGLEEGLFRRLKKAAYGNQVRALNSFEHLCVEQAQGYFEKQEFLTFPQIYETIGIADVEQMIRDWVREDFIALAAIHPKEQKA